MAHMTRRNRPTMDSLSNTLVAAHDRVVQRMLEARRKGSKTVWNGLCDDVYDENGYAIGSWELRQIIVASARAKSLELFDAECKAYAERLKQIEPTILPADAPRPPEGAGAGHIPAHLLERTAAARAKHGIPQ